MMNTFRTFIALALSAEARQTLTDLQNQLKGQVPPHLIRWVAPQTMHLTLHFLGEVSPAAVADISTALHQASTQHTAFDLTLTGVGCFPNEQRPRVVWVGIGGETTRLVALHATLGQQLAQHIGFKTEARPYTPHLTIGWVQKGLPPRQLRQLGPILAQAKAEIGHLAALPVTAIHLYKSVLTPSGPIYTVLDQADLAVNGNW